MIPYSRQSIDDEDVAAVVAVLQGDWLTQGPAVDVFEAALTEVTEARHAVAFSNGTAALHAAVVAGGVRPGDRVATSPLTFVASANCARYAGADVELVDVDPGTLNMDLDQVPDEVDALVAVHFAGLPLDLSRMGRRPGLVIEDAAHALGATTPEGPVGNCVHSDMCAFSFHPVKHITTGEGGAVTTNSAELAERLRRLRHHGIVRRPERGEWCYEVVELGWNYRLTDMQAALGTSQLTKLERFVSRRNELADRYRDLLADLPITLPPAAPPGRRHAYHLFPVRVPDRDRVIAELRSAGVGAQVHYIPIHHHPLYADLRLGRLPAADRAFEQLLSLPLYPDLTETEQDHVVHVLRESL